MFKSVNMLTELWYFSQILNDVLVLQPARLRGPEPVQGDLVWWQRRRRWWWRGKTKRKCFCYCVNFSHWNPSFVHRRSTIRSKAPAAAHGDDTRATGGWGQLHRLVKGKLSAPHRSAFPRVHLAFISREMLVMTTTVWFYFSDVQKGIKKWCSCLTGGSSFEPCRSVPPGVWQQFVELPVFWVHERDLDSIFAF